MAPSPDAAAQSTSAAAIAAAEKELDEAKGREQELELELEKLYGRAAHLCQSESRSLAHAGEQHKQVPAAIRKLQETLQQTSGVADELSSRVRKLDVVCGRVAEALSLVDDMLELRECSDQVMRMITAEDFEQAAKYVSRFRSFKDAMPPGTDDASIRVLREAEVQLSGIVRKRFEAAMAAKDNDGVSRFAKLFHPLGLAGEGVEKYVEFIRRSLAEKCATDFRLLAPSFGKRADAEPNPYAEALTNIFVAIADIIQEHQQAVEEEFGPENFIVVIRGLLEESDTQGLRIIEKFSKDNAKVFDRQDSCNMRDVGLVLEETALMTQRTQQFSSYIQGVAEGVVELVADKEAFLQGLPAGYSATHGLVSITRLVHKIQELVSLYVVVEQKFLLESVEKATSETDCLDAFDPEMLTTTMVDDAFFILQQSMLRAITTCDINAVCAVVNYVGAAVSNELKNTLLANLAEGKRLYGAWVTHAKNLLPPAPGEHPLMTLFVDVDGKLRANLTAASSWPHSLNNLQQCLEYLDRLKDTTERAFDEYFPSEGPDKDKRVMFQHCISALEASKTELDQAHAAKCKEGLQMLKGHLSPMLLPLDNLDYELDEARYAEYQVNDPFAQAFNSQADIIYQHLRVVLNPVSCEEVMQQLAEQTCRRVEKAALLKRFTLFGALQFETDVRALCSFFTNVSEQALRHKFARLFDMASLLNLESAQELRELYGETRTWRLTADEVRKLVQSRVDFDVSESDLDAILPC